MSTTVESLSPKRQALVTAASFGGMQALIAVSAFVRIPFVVTALGTGGYGLNTLVGNTAPVLLATAAGLRIASRTIVAEQIGAGSPALIDLTKRTMRRIGWRALLWQLLLTLPLSWILPFYLWFHGTGITSMTQLQVSMFLASAMCGFAIVGAVAWGGLEAHGRTALVNGFGAVVTVAGLVLTVVAVQFTKSFVVFAVLNTFTTVGPLYLCPLFYRFERRRFNTEPKLRRAALKLSFLGTIQSVPPLATRALDPFVIGAVLGPIAVSSYGVAQRLSLVSTMLPVALVPVVGARLARSRGSRSGLTRKSVFAIAAGFGAVSLILGAILCGIGPWMVHLLARGNFGADRGVFVAFLILGVTFSVQLGLSSAVTGPGAMRFSVYADTVCMAINVALSIWWVHLFGIVGPIYGSAVGTGLDAVLWIVMLLLRSDYVLQVHAPIDASPIDEIESGSVG